MAVFVDGCFWHGCPEHYRAASHNTDFWETKLRENRQRDQNASDAYRAAGWEVLRVWEHHERAFEAVVAALEAIDSGASPNPERTTG